MKNSFTKRGDKQLLAKALELPVSQIPQYIKNVTETMADVEKLIEVLQKLVEAGNTVVVIEHNLDVIKTADYIIDMGPEGGDRGGEIVAQGTPEKVAKSKKSYTGQYLKKVLERK